MKPSVSWPISGSEPASDFTLIDDLLAEQRALTAVERFARAHDRHERPALENHYRRLLPATAPRPGQQYAFEVNLDQCSGCKACVSACHSLNGLDEHETWRGVGLLVGQKPVHEPEWSETLSSPGFQQHVTTACHHCADPGCLNGCPVLAYDKDPITGIVRHLDDQCMGCSYCIMKCPYEVPKYSDRLGIVRKCDLCANRLAVGEAPACVQACPDEAIRITLVESRSVRESYRGFSGRSAEEKERKGSGESVSLSPALLFPSANPFLPDSPNPALTLPTTRYISHRGLLENLAAADHAAPRLDPPHWPLVIMLVLSQAAAGLFLAAAVLGGARLTSSQTAIQSSGLAALVIGLIAATLHLGQPRKAWRAFLGWRRSWLSRELIAFNAFAGAASLAILFSLAADSGRREGWSEAWGNVSIWAAALAGLVAVFSSAMVYVDTGRPFWTARLSFGNFFGTTLLLGASFAAVVLAWSDAPGQVTPATVMAALIIRTALWIWRRLEWRRAWRNAASPIHFNARIIRDLLQHTTTARTALFAASIGFGILAIANLGQAAPWWASLAALTTCSSEIIGRYVFFAAGPSRRMPGGVAA